MPTTRRRPCLNRSKAKSTRRALSRPFQCPHLARNSPFGGNQPGPLCTPRPTSLERRKRFASRRKAQLLACISLGCLGGISTSRPLVRQRFYRRMPTANAEPALFVLGLDRILRWRQTPIGIDGSPAPFQRFAPGCCLVSAVELFLFFNRLGARALTAFKAIIRFQSLALTFLRFLVLPTASGRQAFRGDRDSRNAS